MKDFMALFAVVVLAVAGVGWYLFPGFSRHPLSGPKAAVLSEIPKPHRPEKKNSAVKPKPKIRELARTEQKPQEQKPQEQNPPPLAAPRMDTARVPEPSPVRFPTPVEVPRGQERQQVFDGYGVPTLAASTLDRGHLFEIYVYRRDRSQTNIRMEDGRVASVSLKDLPELTRSAQATVPLHAAALVRKSGAANTPEAGYQRSDAPGSSNSNAATVTVAAENTSAGRAYRDPGISRTAPGDQSNAGVLTVTSEPSGALVEINQVPAGSTPVTLRISPVGLGFTLTIAKEGFIRSTVQTVATAQPSSMHVTLTQAAR